MPDWKATFHAPRMTSSDFTELKRKYIAKYGYTVTYPSMEDIIRIKITEPITIDEQRRWKAKQWDTFTPDRLEELKIWKKRRKEMFLRMLSSPSPHIFNARGSVIGSIDDCQDAISTLAAIGRLAVKYAVPTIAGLIAGPVGWLMRASSFMDMATTVLNPETAALQTKRTIDQMTDLNPKTKKVKYKNAAALARKGFSGGDAIQAAQVSESVFGFGISLGAMMAFPIDFLSGVVRGAAGQPVKFEPQPLRLSYWELVAKKALKGLSCILTAPTKEFVPAFDTMLLTANLAAQIDSVVTQRFNPVEQIPTPEQVECEAPRITNLISREAIEELGHDPDQGIAWPATGKQWSTYTDISNEGYKNANKNYQEWCSENQHSYPSFLASCNAVEASMYLGECATGIGNVAYDYTAWCKTIHALANAGYVFPHFYNARLRTEIQGMSKAPPFSQLPRGLAKFSDVKYRKLEQPYNKLTGLESIDAKYLYHPETFPYGEQFFDPSFQQSFRPGIVMPEASFDNISGSQIEAFQKWLEEHEAQGTTPRTPDVLRQAKEQFGFQFVFTPITSQGERLLTPTPSETLASLVP